MHNSEYYLEWNGVNTNTLEIIVESSSSNSRPERKMEVYSVPGKNGDVIRQEDAWQNINRSYEICVGNGQDKNTPEKFRAIAEWLYGPGGYKVLKDSCEPGYYFLAYFKGPFDVDNMLSRYGRAKITFSCRPERYLVTDNLHGTNLSIRNPTSHPAYPLLKITASSSPSLIPTTGRNTVLDVPLSENLKKLPLTAEARRYMIPHIGYFGGVFRSRDIEVLYSGDTEGTISVKCISQTGIGINRSVKPQTTYTISCDVDSNVGKLSTLLVDKNGNIIKHWELTDSQGGKLEQTFTTTTDSYWAVFIFYGIDTDTYVHYTDIELCFGDEALPYVPYSASGTGCRIRIGGRYLILSELKDVTYVDCETQDIYGKNKTNLNSTASITDSNGNQEEFPYLPGGKTSVISVEEEGYNTISDIEVEPRFWTL